MADPTTTFERIPPKAPPAFSPSTPAPSLSPIGFDLAAFQSAVGNLAMQRTAREVGGEGATVAQQTATGHHAVQRWSDPTATSLTPEALSSWSDDELLEGLELMLDQVAPVVKSVPEGDVNASHENLRLLVVTAVSRHVGIPDNLLARLPLLYGPPNREVFVMYARLDLLGAMVQREFPDQAAVLAPRLLHYRNLYFWLDTLALPEASADLDESITAGETAMRVHRVAVDPGGDAVLSGAVATLNAAIAQLIGTLLTPEVHAAIAAVETARDAWLEQMVQSFANTIVNVREQIAAPIDPNGYGKFSSGLPYNVHAPAFDRIADLEDLRQRVVEHLDRLLGERPDPSATLAARLGYVATKSSELDETCAQVERVLLGLSLCQQGQALADAIFDNEPSVGPSTAALNKLDATLHNLVLRRYTRENLPELRQEVTEAFDRASDNVASLRLAERMVTLFVNIAATLLGIGAMRAVTALASAAGIGKTGATIIGSLAFTGTRLAITQNQGRSLTAGGFLEDAAKDYFLLRLLGGVDARIVARVGDAGVLATAARLGGTYGTLVAWTLTWNVLQPGAPGPAGTKTTSTGDVMVQTGVDLALFMIAEALTRAPALPTMEMTTGRDPNDGKHARLEWEALRRELTATGGQLREWLSGTREDPAIGDKSLLRAADLFARTKALHARFAESGEIDAAQRTQLDANADAMLESIRNLRDEGRLDVRNVTAESWSYGGSEENISAYLARLKTQGRVRDVTPEGNGIFSVLGSDGARLWFFPVGRNTPAVLDIVAESVQAAAPDVPEAIRSEALVHLRGAKWSDLGTFAGGLTSGRGAPFIEWVARPDVGEAIANDNLPMPVVRALAEGTPEQLAPIARENARALPEWYRSWISLHPHGAANDFVATLDDVIAWRGTLQVSGFGEPGGLLSRRENAGPTSELDFTPPSTAPSMSAPGAKLHVYSDVVTQSLKGETIPGAHYRDMMRYDKHYVIEIVEGRVTRLFEIDADGTVTRRIPVESHLARLRSILFKLGTTSDEATDRAALAESDPLLKDLDSLLDFRDGVPVEQIHLIEALARHPLRGASNFGPPTPAAKPRTAGSPRPPRRSIVTAAGTSSSSTADTTKGPDAPADAPSPLDRRPRESEGNFIDRLLGREAREYWESINGPAGRRRENPARWARIQPELGRLVKAMRNMQGRLQRGGQGDLLPQVNDQVLQQPVDYFVNENPALQQTLLEIEGRLRQESAQQGRPLSESPEWNDLQDFLGLSPSKAGARATMDKMRLDLVEFLLEDGSIHISDFTTQDLNPQSVHAFKTRVYVEIMRAIVGPDGPQVTGQDIQFKTDISGKRIDPARTRFGDIIE